MFDTFVNRLELTGKLTTITALRISAGRSSEPIGSDLPVVKDAFGNPLIPGASFKGAMRSRLEAFLRGIASNLAEDPSELATTSRVKAVNALKEKAENDAIATQEILKQTDLVSHLFGAPWLAGKLQIRDLTVQPNTWFGQYQERDGVAIDRDTETAADGKLYDFQVVPAGTTFDFKAVVENVEHIKDVGYWELGLLMIGLHQFENEQIPLGGGRSRGLGVVKLDIGDVWWVDYPEERPEELLTYLQRLVGGEKDAHYKLSSESFDAYKTDWTNALINHLSSQMSVNRVTVEEDSLA